MTPGRQQGAALLLLLAVLTLGGTWYVISGLQAASGDFVAANRRYNAAVLAQAKRALMGYVAHQAAVSGENNPGAFLCPEAAANIGTGNEGLAAGNCTLPAVGRLPWKTIGIEKLQDASGEPLWYVVANGWAKPSAAANTIINSNCTDSVSAMTCWSGQLTVDGRGNAAVALIIAPGKVMSVQASAGCTARNQARTTPSPTINPLDYLECYNTATSAFATNGPGTSFNDQGVTIKAAEVLPLIEGAIADRFHQEFGALMKTAYSGGIWPATSVLPFAVQLNGDATTSPRNKLQGASGVTGGLIPGSYAFAGACTCDAPDTPPCVCSVNSTGERSHELCNVADPRCDSAFVAWHVSSPCGAPNCTSVSQTAGTTLHSYTCTDSGSPTTLTCNINGWTTFGQWLSGNTGMTFNLDAVASNVGMSLRQINNPTASSRSPAITGIDTTYVTNPIGYSVTQGTLNNDGSATVRINARFASGSGTALGALSGITCTFFGIPLLCYQYTVSVPIGVVADHPLVDATNTAYNWFFRNKWHEVSYYAIAAGIAPSGARSCTTSSTCLQVNYTSSADSGKQRGILVIGGQKLSTLDGAGNPYTQARPATQVKDLLDDINANGASPFELRSATLAPNRAFNDRFAVIDKNP
jgi:hypothetical protein